MTPAVRISTGADIPAIAALRARWGGADPEPGFEGRVAAWLTAEGDRRTVFLAEIDRAAVGMATVLEYRRMPWPGHPDACWGYIGSMFVREEWRGRGVGGALLRALLDTAERRGYTRLVVRPSPEAMPFYRRAGFAPADGRDGEALLVRAGATAPGG